MADYTQGLPDVQDLLGSLIGQIQPNMKATQDQMGAMQDYIKNQQRDQLNIPALQFAAGLLKPTKTGSFAESVGNAGEGALGALQKQREIDLDRQAKILELTQAKGALLAQQTQMLMPFAQMQMVQKAFGDAGGGGPTAAPGGAADPSAGPVGVPGAGSMGGAPAPAGGLGPIPDPLAKYRGLLQMAAITKNPQLATAAAEMMRNSPELQAALKGATVKAEHAAALPFVGPEAGAKVGAEKAAGAPYDLLDVRDPATGAPGKMSVAEYLKRKSGMPAMPGIPKPAPVHDAPAASGSATVEQPKTNQAGPQVDPNTAEVKSYVPPPPPGGGLPTIPPGSTGLPPGYDEQMKEAAKVPAEWAQESGDLDTMKNRFRELNYLGKLTESNQWATSKSEIASHLKAIALAYDPAADVSKMDADKWGKPAETQQVIKDVTQLAMAAARAQGARGTNMVLQEAMLTTPQADMQPAARWTLINHGIAAIDRRQQMISDWQAAQANGWKDPNVFEQQWLKANPIDKWIQATSQKAGNFAGMPLPAKLHIGAVYVAPKGSRHAGELGVWNGKSFDPPDPNDLTGMGPK